uniref:VPS11_C domain-containing protein n=1 Tax=Macrostomum lignano TaxID=282301 RepID=A0A1I8FEW0_9PLAT
ASPSRSLLIDIAVNYLLQPTIELFASPDYVNQNIIWFSREDAYAYEFLMQAVLTAEVDGEVKALLEFVNSEMSRLRSQDAATGGGGLPTNQPTKADYQTDGQSGRDELNGIKQQLSSQRSGRDAASLRASISEQAASIFAMYFDSAGGGGSGGGGGAGGADRLPLLNPGQGYRSLLEEMDLLREDTVSRNSCEGEIDSPLADQEAEDAASPMEEYEVQYSAKIMRHELIKRSPAALASPRVGLAAALAALCGATENDAPMAARRTSLTGVKRNLPAHAVARARGWGPARLCSAALERSCVCHRFGSGGSGEGRRPRECAALRILLLVMDEDFRRTRTEQTHTERHHCRAQQAGVRALLGDRVNRRIVQFARVLTSADRVAYYLQSFRASRRPPTRLATSATLMRTRLLCRANCSGQTASCPQSCAKCLGNQTN